MIPVPKMELFSRDNDIGNNVYRHIFRSDPLTLDELITANLLRLTNSTTCKGMNAATLKRSDKLKARLLKTVKNPRSEFGDLWCWVVCNDHAPYSGSVMRLVTANNFLGSENIFYTFRTVDSFKHPDPSYHGTHTFHAREFQLVWVSAGPDLATGKVLKGWQLEVDAI